MKTICVLSRKGGVGKSTISFHLSSLVGRSSLVNLDEQGSCAVWHANREDKTNPAYVGHKEVLNFGLATIIRNNAKRGVDYTIIDTPPHSSAEVTQAVKVADVVVVPMEPSEFSFAAIRSTLDIVEAHGKRAVMVLSRAEPGERETKEGIEMLEQSSMPYAVIYSRVAFKRTIPSGTTVHESGSDKKAIEEIEALWGVIKEQMQ